MHGACESIFDRQPANILRFNYAQEISFLQPMFFDLQYLKFACNVEKSYNL